MSPGEIAYVLFGTALSFLGLFDAVLRPPEAWTAIRRSQTRWVGIQLALAPLGTVLYLLLVRPRLRAAERT